MSDEIFVPKQPGFFRRAFDKITAGGWLLLFFAVILPAITVAVEMVTGICGEMFFDPMPTPLQTGLIVTVPLFNLLVWLGCRLEKMRRFRALPFLCGFSLIIAGVNAILFLPLAMLGMVAFFFFWWVYGLGLLGILPTAPFFAFIASFFLRLRLKRTGDGRLSGFGWGMVAAGLGVLLTIVGYGAALSGVWMTKSGDPDIAARGIRLLRLSGRKDVLERFRTHPQFSLTGWLIPEEKRLTHDEYRALYYRVTGDDPVTLDMWSAPGRRRLLRWDAFTGGSRVGGVLEGLSLTGSTYDYTVDSAAGVGYVEWVMVFSNTYYSDREARARIALPPGSVVSRLTLWINGEECEAAFGKRGQVRAAYESVVSKRRDPVLVGMCGPDQIQLQCFPVPKDGEMKVRIGVTIPLKVAKDGCSAVLPSPHLFAQNFSYSADLLGLPVTKEVTLEPAFAPLAVYRDEAFEPLKDGAILQKATFAEGWRPERVAVVVDGSKSMKRSIAGIAQTLASLPEKAEVSLWLVGDGGAGKPDLVSPAGDPERAKAIGALLKPGACVGGRCNLRALVAAAESLEGKKGPSALLWIHGDQPAPSQSAETVAQRFGKLKETRIFPLQLGNGSCLISERMEKLPNVFSLTAAALEGSPEKALKACFDEWTNPAWQVTRTRVPKTEVPAEAVAVGKHLGRIWAAETVRATVREGQPKTLEEAQAVALPWQIVTPVTGAVVLETAQQYQEHGLKPMNANDVPTVPEPAAIFSFALALAILAAWLFWRRRGARLLRGRR